MQIVFSPCILQREKSSKTNKNMNEFLKKSSSSSSSNSSDNSNNNEKNKSLSQSFTPLILCIWWFGYGGRKNSILHLTVKTMQIICQMKKIRAESWCVLEHIKLKKHSIKIQSIYFWLSERILNAVQKIVPKKVCVLLLHRRCFARVYAVYAYMQRCDWNMQIYPGKLWFFFFSLHIFFSFYIFWSFSCISEIHSLDTLNNYSHCSAYFFAFSSPSSYYAWRNDDLMWQKHCSYIHMK